MKHSLIHSVIVFLILMALTFSTVGVTPAYAATFTVTTTSNNGAGSLRQALVDAPSGSTITFAASLSGTTIYLAAPLDIVKKVKIDGSTLSSKVTISGDSNGNGSGDVGIFTNSAGTLGDSVKLDSLIITLGWAFNPKVSGGGIFNTGFLNVSNCIFDFNSAYSSGGAIYNSGMLTITNSTFSNNFAKTGGGGIYNDGTLTVMSGAFFNNDTMYDTGGGKSSGGGIYNSGILSVTNSALVGNSATNFGGGIYNSSILSVTNSTLSGNLATNDGGGIYNTNTLTVTNSTLAMNHTASVGGGISTEGGATARVSNSTINNNTSDFSAGGIYNAGNLVLINSTLSGNLANLDGGAMFNNSLGVANIYNSTIAFNGADWDADINGGQAGGIYNSAGAVFNLINSLVAGNSVSGAPVYDDCYGTLSSYGGNLIGTASESPSGASCTINFVGGSWLNLNDLNLLGPLQDNGGPTATIALLPGNNAIDHGNGIQGCVDDSNVPLVADQRGSARVAGTWCDIGAYEFNDYTPPTVASIVRANPNPTNLANVNFSVTFSESVTGVDASDFTLTKIGVSGAAVSGVSGSGSVYTVTVNTGSGSGTIRLDVIDNDSILDAVGNKLGGTGTDNGNFTSGDSYTIYKSAGSDTAGVFRPSTATFYLRNSNSAGSPNITIKLGKTGDYPVVGDWDGNGTDTIGVYRNGIFYLSNSNTTGHVDLTFAFGVTGDQPIAGDWNGDGKDTIGVYRSSKITFLLRNTNSAGAADATFKLGNPGDVGIAGDWNADGKDTTGVFRPSNGAIYLKNVNTTGYADTVITYGVKNDKPVTGDWNNDGIASIGIFRNAQFYLRNTNTKGYADFVFAFGAVGDMPLAGNWDGVP